MYFKIQKKKKSKSEQKMKEHRQEFQKEGIAHTKQEAVKTNAIF